MAIEIKGDISGFPGLLASGTIVQAEEGDHRCDPPKGMEETMDEVMASMGEALGPVGGPKMGVPTPNSSRDFFIGSLPAGSTLLDFFGGPEFGIMTWTDGTNRHVRGWSCQGGWGTTQVTRSVQTMRLEEEILASVGPSWAWWVADTVRTLFNSES